MANRYGWPKVLVDMYNTIRGTGTSVSNIYSTVSNIYTSVGNIYTRLGSILTELTTPTNSCQISGRYGDAAGEIDDIRIDASTSVLTSMSYEHHEIHGGSSFSCSYTQTVSDTNDRSIIVFKTATGTKYVHVVVAASATAAAVAKITEAPTVTDNTGATLAVYNRNRTGTPAATTVIDISQNPDTAGAATYFTEATMGNVTAGTMLDSIPLGAGQGPKTIGGTARAVQEWVLAPNTLYAFEVISSTNDDNIHWVELNFYEHTDKH